MVFRRDALLSLMFLVDLYVPWCPGVKPQLYVDNLQCVSSDPVDRFPLGMFGWLGRTLVLPGRGMRDRLVSDEVDRLSWIGHLDSALARLAACVVSHWLAGSLGCRCW